MSKKNKRNLLIVCEGTNTEPAYFAFLAQRAKEKGMWDYIEISPKSKLEYEDTENERSGNNKNRPKKQLKSVKSTVSDNEFLTYLKTKYGNKEGEALYENSYKAVPTRYVAEVEEKMEEGTYDQGWAVYDKNGHPKHEDALKMINLTKLAISSISFEFWILLHFEKTKYAFVKSADAEAQIQNYYLPNYSKRIPTVTSKNYTKLISDFKNNIDILFKNVFTAIENAAWLRYKMKDQIANNPIYEVNPITDVDRLLNVLLGITNEIIWTGLGIYIIDSKSNIIISIYKNIISIEYKGFINFNANNVIDLFQLRDLDNKNIYNLSLVPGSFQKENNSKFKLAHQQSNYTDLVLEFTVSSNLTLLIELF